MQSFSNDFKKNHLLKLIRKNIARVNTVWVCIILIPIYINK
jgi:ribosomal protein L29